VTFWVRQFLDKVMAEFNKAKVTLTRRPSPGCRLTRSAPNGEAD
jgi:hypothetical protein